MKTIEEHNEEAWRRHGNKYLTGIECPSCKAELQFANNTILLSSPGQREVKCFTCGHENRVFV